MTGAVKVKVTVVIQAFLILHYISNAQKPLRAANLHTNGKRDVLVLVMLNTHLSHTKNIILFNDLCKRSQDGTTTL